MSLTPLEVVHVEHYQGETLAETLEALHLAADGVVEVAAVVEAGELVQKGALLLLQQHLHLHDDRVAHLGAEIHEIIAHGHADAHVPAQGKIQALVVEQDLVPEAHGLFGAEAHARQQIQGVGIRLFAIRLPLGHILGLQARLQQEFAHSWRLAGLLIFAHCSITLPLWCSPINIQFMPIQGY